MNVVKFKEPSLESKDHIIFCIVDRISACKENQEAVKNISDWTIQNITILGYTVLVSADEDTLLQTAAEFSAKHAVVLSTGLEFVNSYEWFECVEKLCQEDFFIAGHILDRKEFYYELHEQCYVINLDTYKKLNQPAVGQQKFFYNHYQMSPLRSQENYHGDYTPTWIKPGVIKLEYSHQAHGWNLISLALENKLPIKIFNENLRNNKRYYYPEYASYHDQVGFLYARQGFCSGAAIYLNNSETIVPVNIQGPVQQLVVSASGLNWLNYLSELGFDSNTKVKFYDYSFLTLEYIKYLIETWDGSNYKNFAEAYHKNKFSMISEYVPYCGSSQFTDIDQSIWQKVIQTVKFEYHWCDLLNTETDVSWIENVPNTIVNLTNVFNYIGTATLRSVKNRIHSENDFIQKLQTQCPNAHTIFTRRAASGFADLVVNCDVTAQELELTDIKSLTKPTWHSQDWTN